LQVDQVTQALIERQAGRGDLERRVAELEQELSSLGMLAGRLEGDKADLEEQLAEAREAQVGCGGWAGGCTAVVAGWLAD
jgi:septal ring factor EnvC (AmiA/AmiB activator)